MMDEPQVEPKVEKSEAEQIAEIEAEYAQKFAAVAAARAADLAAHEAKIAELDAFTRRLRKQIAVRDALIGKVDPKKLKAAHALMLDTLALDVIEDRVVVRDEYGDQTVDTAVATWLASPDGRAFASSPEGAAAGVFFEELARRTLH